ncbi:MAG: polysaccharide deacetylase family protein [Planctomycetota bacterium]
MAKTIYLRVDVDFHVGLERGVPYLLKLLASCRAKATFFVVMGPDTLHRHARRLHEPKFRRRLVALDLWRIARRLGPAYLRSRWRKVDVATGCPHILRAIGAHGHELGVHGFDHADWADRCFEMTDAETVEHMDRAFAAFEKLVGQRATAWAAPNWRANSHMLRHLPRARIHYSSDCRGAGPFSPITDGAASTVPQIPVTLPCLHELVQVGIPAAKIPAVFERCLTSETNVWCVHDYYEGLLNRGLFKSVLDSLHTKGFEIRPLGELAARLDPAKLASDTLVAGEVPGGARPISCQALFRDENYFHQLETASV